MANAIYALLKLKAAWCVKVPQCAPNAKVVIISQVIYVWPVPSQAVKFVPSPIQQTVQVVTPSIISNPIDAISAMVQSKAASNALVHQCALSVILGTISQLPIPASCAN